MVSNLETSEFSEEQKSYLSGFVTGVLQAREMPFLGQDAQGCFTHESSKATEQNVYGTPIDELCREEVIKYEQHGLDCYDAILENAKNNEFPKDGDVFRYKFHGLFFVSPAQESLMLRARIAGGALNSLQLRAFAEMSQDWSNGYVDITTRANFQLREILPPNADKVLMKLCEVGLTSLGAGADNVRNITASATTGFDSVELLDVLPYAKAMHYYILKNRDLYGLPRKFNIAYDSGAEVSTCADTNDIGFYAVEVKESTSDIPAGVYFRMQLCGITGHQQFASDSGVLLTPEESIPVAAALMRVFIENGDRTNRKKARLKYLVDAWGIEKLLAETQKKLAFPLRYFSLDGCESSLAKTKHKHLGIHEQKDGNFYIGVLVPVGRMKADQVKALAAIADRYGKGEVRLTVWQNVLIPHISARQVEAACAAIIAAGLDYRGSEVTGGLIACTGSKGCKYAAADTKGNAVDIGNYLKENVALDVPINIHFTGCNHSCAQHYIGDIGMMGVRVKTPTGETEEGYNVVLGGGVDDEQAIAREIWKSIPARELPFLLERLLKWYLAERVEGESFVAFCNSKDVAVFQSLLAS